MENDDVLCEEKTQFLHSRHHVDQTQATEVKLTHRPSIHVHSAVMNKQS